MRPIPPSTQGSPAFGVFCAVNRTFENSPSPPSSPASEIAERLFAARCALCQAGSFVVQVDAETKRVTHGLVRVKSGYICPECASEASVRYAQMARRVTRGT